MCYNTCPYHMDEIVQKKSNDTSMYHNTCLYHIDGMVRKKNLRIGACVIRHVSIRWTKWLVITPAKLIHYDKFRLRKEMFINSYVVHGELPTISEFRLVSYNDLLVKVAFSIQFEDKCIFFIFPNTSEST